MHRSIPSLLLAVLLLSIPLQAQLAPEDVNWDDRFTSPPVMNGPVHAILVVGEDVYVGGAFTQIEGTAANNIARWNRGTQSWSPLGEGTNGPVYSLAMLGDSLYVGGNFMMIGSQSANFIAVYRPADASWYPLGLGINGFVYTMALDGEDLYVGGEFEAANDVFARNIARWDRDEKKWYALGTGAGTRPGDGVHSIVIDGDSLYAGGYFEIAGGKICNHIARYGLNDTTWHQLGSGSSHGVSVSADLGQRAIVYSLAIDGDYLYAGGRFDSVAGAPASNTARWNLSGAAWSQAATAIGDASTYAVAAIAIIGDELFVGSRDYPTTTDRHTAPFLMRWNIPNTGWLPLGSGVDDSVLVMTVDNRRLYIGGAFSRSGELAVNGVGVWDETSSLWSGLHSLPGFSPNNTVHAVALSGSDVYAAGDFSVAGDTIAGHVAQFNGTDWLPLGSGVNGRVTSMAVGPGKVYVGGLFTRAGSSDAVNVAVWDIATRQWSGLGDGVNGEVGAIAVDGNNVYVGGSFTVAGTVDVNKVAHWNGTAWSSLGTGDENGISGTVNAMAIVDGDLYVGGNIFDAGTVSVDFVARWNRTTSAWSALAEGTGGPVYAMAGRGKELFVGGEFQVAGTTTVANIARWNIQTQQWDSLGAGLNRTVYGIAVDGNRLYAVGDFTASGSVDAQHIAISDGTSGSAWQGLGSGLAGYTGRDSVAIALAVNAQGAWVGGTMLSAGGKPSIHFGHWTAPPASAPIEPTLSSGNLAVGEARPNPAVGTTEVPFVLRRAGDVRMTIVSVDGADVAQPINRWFAAGEQSAHIDLAGIAPGVYICLIRNGSETVATKIIVR